MESHHILLKNQHLVIVKKEALVHKWLFAGLKSTHCLESGAVLTDEESCAAEIFYIISDPFI